LDLNIEFELTREKEGTSSGIHPICLIFKLMLQLIFRAGFQTRARPKAQVVL